MDDYLDCTLRDLGPEAIAKLERYAVGRGIPVDRAARDMIVQYGVNWENHG